MESKEIPAADKTYSDFEYYNHSLSEFSDNEKALIKEMMHEYAVLFARHHVREALKEASMKARMRYEDNSMVGSIVHYENGDENVCIDSLSILNTYTEDKIK